MALSNNPDFLKARRDLEAKRHIRNKALGAFLPSADGSLSRTHAGITSSDDADSLNIGLDVSVPLFKGFGTSSEAMKAWREWQAEGFSYLEESSRIRQSLRSSFIEMLRLEKLLVANEKIAARRQENAEMIRLRYEAGRENEGSWRRAQAIAEQSQFEVRQTQRKIKNQSLVLGKQMGGYFDFSLSVDGDLETLLPSAPESVLYYAALAEKTPSVLRLIKNAEAMKAAIISAQAEMWPDVEGGFSYDYSGTRASDLDSESRITLQVSVPLFNGGRNIQDVLRSNAEYRSAVEQARSERDTKIAELSESWTAFRDAWELVSVRRSFLDASRKRSEIVKAQYTSGLSSFQEFDIAEQELADSEKAYVQALSDVLVKESLWILENGMTLEEVINAK